MNIIPLQGESMATIRNRYEKIDLDVATIDNNKDGIFNYGKNFGDTIKVFDWENKTAMGHHLVKQGEINVENNYGNVDTTRVPLGQSLGKTFKGLTEKEIQEKYPNATLVNPKGGNTFDPGSTIMLKSANGSRHNVHYVASGELPATTLKMTGAKDLSEVQSDNGIFAGGIVWHDVPANK